MEHSEVVRLKVVERYILGELSPEDREHFEEHYFDCLECASDIKALARIRSASRMILEEDAAAEVSSREQRKKHNWFAWLKPIVAVPAIAALAVIAIFQAVKISSFRERAVAVQVAQIYASTFRLQGTTRGESASQVTVPPNESFGLDFDFTPSATFERYEGSLIDPTGKAVLTFGVKGEDGNKELHLVVPAGAVRSGKYDLVFHGESGTMNSDPSAKEVQRLFFVVDVRP